MSAIANKRKLLEAAQALVKTNRPTPEHYLDLMNAISDVFFDDTGDRCQCRLSPAKAEQS